MRTPTVGISGTGGGFQKFCRGESDISNASRPISAAERQACQTAAIAYIELPVAYDGLAVVVNPKNTWADSITVAELKRLWAPEAQGTITRWNQVRSSWPDREIHLFGAGVDSGTYDYFTEAIVGKAKSSRGDYTASEDDNVLVSGVSGDKNALGYFGYAYYAENKDKLKAIPIMNPTTNKPVSPAEKTVMDSSYSPLARPIFIYVSTKALQRPHVKAFAEFYLDTAADSAKDVKYIPLPSSAYESGKARLKAAQTGTAYGGKAEAGVPIDELFKRELKE